MIKIRTENFDVKYILFTAVKYLKHKKDNCTKCKSNTLLSLIKHSEELRFVETDQSSRSVVIKEIDKV